MKRRAFLKDTSLAALTVGAPARVSAANGGERTRSGQTLSVSQWSTIEAVQDHLLPSEPGAPGARDINATAYLDRTLADPRFDPDVRGFILKGIGWLDEISQEKEALPFQQVEPAKREDLLRHIAQSAAGERWISNLVTYCLEALLADPLYGGNPGGIGWKWLDHDPGRPRPSANKIYGRLGKT